jgi:hypothetical protein
MEASFALVIRSLSTNWRIAGNDARLAPIGMCDGERSRS